MPDLRPTHDRLRETLFNWLMSDIADANCLDLFAGSGALGFEALSRDAASVTFIDNNPMVITQLQQNAVALQATDYKMLQGMCFSDMPSLDTPFDIVFLDPPYHSGLVLEAAVWLEREGLMVKDSWIYIETAKGESLEGLPDTWALHRQKSTKQINYALYQKLD